MLHFFFDLLYSMVMKALIPNKDTLFFLSKLQKEILKKTRCNPIYPLYCFQNEFPETISSFTILSPVAEDNQLYFPIEINSIQFKIPFGVIKEFSMNVKDILNEYADQFPRRERVFKISDASITSDAWEINNEKWVKIKQDD